MINNDKARWMYSEDDQNLEFQKTGTKWFFYLNK